VNENESVKGFIRFGERELGKMGDAWLIAGQPRCP
jgi:hypothetical protein